MTTHQSYCRPAGVCNRLVQRFWEKRIGPGDNQKSNMAAEDDSESMNFQLFLRDFQHVIDYLGTQRKLMDAHMVDYFTSNHWETLLPLQIRKDLESLSPLELASLPTACNDESETFDNVGHHLKNFLNEAKMAQLKSFSWLKDAKEFSSELKVGFISHIMSPKKSYEVEVMSDVVHRMATQFNVRKVSFSLVRSNR